MLLYSQMAAVGRIGGWFKDTIGEGDGGDTLGNLGAIVWDGEVARMAEALVQGPHDRGVLILADSMAAIQAVKKAGRTRRPEQGNWSSAG